ncbi:MAG: hypothetical protein ACI4NM_02245 [Bullifex sp.]
MRKIFLFLISAFILMPLNAETLRVGLYGVPSYLEEDLKASLSAFIEAGTASSGLEETVKSRLEEKAYREAREKAHSLLVSEKELTEEKSFEFSGIDKVEFLSITPDERIKALFEDLDINALSYVKERADADIILIFSSHTEGQLVFIDSYIHDGETKPFISTVHIVASPPDLYDDFIIRFSELYYADAGFIRREGGRLRPVVPGEHESDGIVYTVEAGEVVELVSEIIQGEEKTFTLFSVPFDASLSVFALDSVSLPTSVTSDEDNIILALSKPGFLSDTYQLSSSSPSISALSLRPEWMGRDGRVKEAKDDFYRALRDTFLSFSLYAISSSLSNIYPAEMETWGSLLKTFTAGVSFVSLMNLIKTCGAYYNCAKETYL